MTQRIGELTSSSLSLPYRIYSEKPLHKRVRDWQEHQSLHFATDLLSEAFIAGKGELAVDAAEFVLQHPRSSKAARHIAQRVLAPDKETTGSELLIKVSTKVSMAEEYGLEIHSLRQRLYNEPRNAILYVDIARYYTILGQIEKAKKMMNVALQITNNNRFVVRSAVRLYLHLHDLGHAARILRSADNTAIDPWLLSADISVAALMGRLSKHVKSGIRMVNDAAYHPRQISELASALATLEFKHGASKKSRKLFARALVDPTENSVAQAAWVDRNGMTLNLGQDLSLIHRSHEAQAYKNFFECEWDESVNEALSWLADQPFSGRPATLAAYICHTLIDDYDKGAEILKRALQSNPGEAAVLNDLVFALASGDKLKEANKAFNSIDRNTVGPGLQITLKATEGLLHFRQGDPDYGRSLYLEAIQEARREGLKERAALASLMLLREDLRLNSNYIDNSLELADRLVSDMNRRPDFSELFKRFTNAAKNRKERD